MLCGQRQADHPVIVGAGVVVDPVDARRGFDEPHVHQFVDEILVVVYGESVVT